jgi:hypothetical protein
MRKLPVQIDFMTYLSYDLMTVIYKDLASGAT